jgi:hypothetical protein
MTTSTPAGGITVEEALKRRPRAARGSVPKFFQDPATDRLLTVVVALMGEVATLRDRLDTHERLAAAGRVATPENVEAYRPDPDVRARRDAERQRYLERVMRAFTEEAQRLGGPKAVRTYALDEFAHPDLEEETAQAVAATRGT